MKLSLTILMLLVILSLAALLTTAYIITPVINWLVTNPLGGVALLIVVIVLSSILVKEELKENPTERS